MSRKIEHILEVIEEIWEQYQNTESDMTLTEMRINAARAVAGRRGVYISTINDTYLRQLGDSVNSTQDFDLLVEQWLHHDSGPLKAILLRHTSDPADIPKINSVFSKVSEPDVFLAREFGLEPNEELFIEGKQKLKLHLVKERNRYLVKRAKEIWKNSPDGMRCSICSFSFIQTYGTVGDGFIEAHHSKPISSLEPDTIVRPSDLVPVCSNCHRMLHRKRPWLTVDELKHIVESHAASDPQDN